MREFGPPSTDSRTKQILALKPVMLPVYQDTFCGIENAPSFIPPGQLFVVAFAALRTPPDCNRPRQNAHNSGCRPPQSIAQSPLLSLPDSQIPSVDLSD